MTGRIPHVSWRHVGVVLALMGILNALVGALLIVTYHRATQAAEKAAQIDADLVAYVACRTVYLDNFARSYRQRVKAQRPVADAIDAVVLASANDDEEGLQSALLGYLQVRRGQLQAQADNPLPPIPRDSCTFPPEAEPTR